MTPRRQPPEPSDRTDTQLPTALAAYADRLLLGTGLDASGALRIASSQLEPPPELQGLAIALRAGWEAAADPA